MTRKILALWAVPRSTSTAFEWMMRQRGDMECLHEPYGEAWYQGETPLWPRYKDGDKSTPGLTLESVSAVLDAAALRGPVFIKDFPLYLDTIWTDAFLERFTHSFLIRDPAKTIASMAKHWPDFHPKEVGLVEQRALFDRLAERDGVAPPVIDSDDLLADPDRVVRAYCTAVGIPFRAEAMRWEPGPRDEVSWWDGGSFHENLRNSTGLSPQPARHANIADLPPRAREIYDAVRPHYERLWAHRITA